ncbi:hypothetical protein [Tepidibacillus marianensis]|uniref:hypothetical protein n=1 Tax=Tepidibacillus marianensis TaxID=3131995 RepID=UPI0030CBFAE2
MLLIIVGFLVFAIQIREMMKHKMKSKLDIGFQVAIYAVYGAAVSLVIALFVFLAFGDKFLIPFAFLFLVGWIGFSILGYLFKIVPFLWWTDKYSEKVGKEPVPMLKDMVDEKMGKMAFLLLFIGTLINTLGIGTKLSFLVFIGNTIYLAGGLFYSYLVLRIFRT